MAPQHSECSRSSAWGKPQKNPDLHELHSFREDHDCRLINRLPLRDLKNSGTVFSSRFPHDLMTSFRIDPAALVHTLGPEGTFSDQAARVFQPLQEQVRYSRTFAEALFQVSANPDAMAVVPIENSVAGTVSQVQDSLVSEDLVILSEVNLPIGYSLLASAELEKIQTLYAHPQALEQSSGFVTRQLPGARPSFTYSNIDSGIRFLEQVENSKDPVAALVPASFALKHPQFLSAADIQDYKNNTTRFLLVQKRGKDRRNDFSKTKTALYVEFQEDRPGLLYRMLSVFNLFGVNLCRLESRPSKTTPWMYVFYVDFYNLPETEACLEVLKTSRFSFKILGSYDVKKYQSFPDFEGEPIDS